MFVIASNTWYTLQKAKKKSNLLLKITWIANENRKLKVRIKTTIRRKLIAINLVTSKRLKISKVSPNLKKLGGKEQ